MPQTSAQAKTNSKFQPRDASGHFAFKPKSGIKAKVSVSFPLLHSDVKLIPEFEKPLIQLSITNPFKKIL